MYGSWAWQCTTHLIQWRPHRAARVHGPRPESMSHLRASGDGLKLDASRSRRSTGRSILVGAFRRTPAGGRLFAQGAHTAEHPLGEFCHQPTRRAAGIGHMLPRLSCAPAAYPNPNADGAVLVLFPQAGLMLPCSALFLAGCLLKQLVNPTWRVFKWFFFFFF